MRRRSPLAPGALLVGLFVAVAACSSSSDHGVIAGDGTTSGSAPITTAGFPIVTVTASTAAPGQSVDEPSGSPESVVARRKAVAGMAALAPGWTGVISDQEAAAGPGTSALILAGCLGSGTAAVASVPGWELTVHPPRTDPMATPGYGALEVRGYADPAVASAALGQIRSVLASADGQACLRSTLARLYGVKGRLVTSEASEITATNSTFRARVEAPFTSIFVDVVVAAGGEGGVVLATFVSPDEPIDAAEADRLLTAVATG